MEKHYPRVLVISHNMFGFGNNMGRTLNAMFQGWDINNIAQLCFQSEKDVGDVCRNFYRITDTDVLRSIVKGTRCGRRMDVEQEAENLGTGRGHNKILLKFYDYARKRVPIVYLMRSLLWRTDKWHTEALDEWIDEFAPEIIFFASGDYAFAYDIAYEIASTRNIPIMTYCCDDHYLHEPKRRSLLARHNKKRFMKSVQKVMDKTSVIATICEKMMKDYSAFFKKDAFALYTSTLYTKLDAEKENKISYIGHLSLDRDKEILRIAKALKNVYVGNKPSYVDVYSRTDDEKILKNLTAENGVRFNGPLDSKEVTAEIAKSLAVIHVESLSSNDILDVRYSVSTKIADSLASGTPLLAVGPADIASIEYLRDNDAAFVVSDAGKLEETLIKLLTDEKERERITKNALLLAEKNHNYEKNTELLRNKMSEIVLANKN